ncbi:MAG: FHA domain-containing protein [Desulfobacterales bacterium]|nr:FHA domain-containing protein [Desulfobacterales bacterium]
MVELPAGAAALALPALWRELTAGRQPAGASFFSSRPVERGGERDRHRIKSCPRRVRPTCSTATWPTPSPPARSRSERILRAEGRGIRIEGEPGGIDSRHCSVQLQGGQAVLTDLSANGTFLNDRRVGRTRGAARRRRHPRGKRRRGHRGDRLSGPQ